MDELVFPIIAVSLAAIALSSFGLLVALLATNFQAGPRAAAKRPALPATSRTASSRSPARAVINDDTRSWLREQDEKIDRPV